MTHTKDTREAIAQIIAERAEIGVSGDAPLDYGVSNPEELADAILTALEPTPAGGEWTALPKGKNPKFGDLIENRSASMDNPTRRGVFVRVIYRQGRINRGKWFEVTDTKGEFWQVSPDAEIFTATPAQGGDQTWPDDLVTADMSNEEFFQALRDYASKRQSEGAKAITISLETFKMLLPDTPAQPTPSGEIDALFEKARDAAAEAERNHRPDPNCSSTAASDAVEAYESVIRAALTATPAQATPSGEVDGLVAEIDAAYEKAGWDGEQFDENCIRHPEDFNLAAPSAMEELNSMRLLVNAWPSLRTALGGGWRDDMENLPLDTPVDLLLDLDGANPDGAAATRFTDIIVFDEVGEKRLKRRREGDDNYLILGWSFERVIGWMPLPPLTREEG